MKRVLFVALLASAILVTTAAPALAVEYRLTIAAYWDADGDGCWDCDEIVLPGLQGQWGAIDPATGMVNASIWETDSCGWYKFTFPAGLEVRVAAPEKLPPMFGDPNYVRPGKLTEITPSWPGHPDTTRVFMTRNRCVLFGVAPYEPD